MDKYIDADAAIEIIKSGYYSQDRGHYEFESDYMRALGYNTGLDHVAHDLAGIPPTDVEPVRHGRWETSDIPGEHFKCSECGGGCWYYDYHGDVAKSNYCPNCGAKMDEDT